MPDDQTIQGGSLEDMTFRGLFAPPPGGTELAARIDTKDFQEVAKQVSSLAQPVPWSRVQSEVSGLIANALDTSLLDAWARAWQSWQKLKDDADESRKSPTDVKLSPIASHSIESSLHPWVEVLIGPKSIQKIVFDVTLTTELKGLVLGLQNGKIISLELAQCEWAGTIAVKSTKLIERKLKKLDLAGCIRLKRPIEIGS